MLPRHLGLRVGVLTGKLAEAGRDDGGGGSDIAPGGRTGRAKTLEDEKMPEEFVGVARVLRCVLYRWW